jgi:hypothetical protein
MLERRLVGGETWGRHHPIVWGGYSNDEIINNIKYIVAFGSHRLTPYHTTTNQKHAGEAEVSVEKRFGWADMQRGY